MITLKLPFNIYKQEKGGNISDQKLKLAFTPPASEICRWVGFQLIIIFLVGFSPRSEVFSLIEIDFRLNTFDCGVAHCDQT